MQEMVGERGNSTIPAQVEIIVLKFIEFITKFKSFFKQWQIKKS